MEEPGVIYDLIDCTNDFEYIGQTTRPIEVRFREHACADTLVGSMIQAHGADMFVIVILKVCYTREELDFWERHFIKYRDTKYPNGYNRTEGGDRGPVLTGEDNYWFGKHIPPESTVKMADAKRADTPYQNLLNEMLERQLSYGAFAKLVGMTQSALSMKMRDKLQFTEDDVDKFVAFFGKPAEYLFARTDGKPLVLASRSGEKNPFFGKHHKDKDRMTFSENNRGDSPYKNLLAEMAKRFISYRNLAVLLAISQANLSRKMLGERRFTRKDINKLVEIFGMPAEYLLARDDGQIMVPSNRGKTSFKNLAKELQKQNISYTDLGKILGVTHQSISEKMSGKKKFTDAQWQKLSEILGKPAEYLMQRDDG